LHVDHIAIDDPPIGTRMVGLSVPHPDDEKNRVMHGLERVEDSYLRDTVALLRRVFNGGWHVEWCQTCNCHASNEQ
jgi:hypothetical protein